MNEKKRTPIRRKVQRMVLAISVAALVLTSITGLIGMTQIQEESGSALTHQMEQNLYSLVTSKASLADSELGKYAGYVANFASYIHELYSNPSAYLGREVLPPDAKNAGRYVMQRSFTRREVKLEDVAQEMALLGNLEAMWNPVITSNKDVITTIYIGTKSGFMLSYDTDSALFVEEGSPETYFNYFSSSWYRMAMFSGGVCFTNVYQDSYGRGLMISCASPFFDARNQFAGVVCMDILISNLYRAVVNLELGRDAYAFLVDGAGKMITPPDQEESAQVIYQDQSMGAYVTGQVLVGNTGVALAESGIYYAYTPIQSTGWKLCIRVPQAMILEPVRAMDRNVLITMLTFLAGFIVITALVFVIAKRFSARLTAPIVSLERDVEQISGGNLDYRAEIQDNDEIGDLARSFNAMAASLKDYIKNLAAVTAEKERIGAELNVATQIQADMLPRIFPPFPCRKEFDIYATMNPAKEVGGDFYDFFLIDEDHLALVIADVSGKGVPAALFMVVAKTLIKNRTLMGGTPSEILAAVNNQLCEGNEADLFVTVWLGILEISTGKVVNSNAGHEYPALKRAEGSYELMKGKHSPAVATMEGLKFRETEFELHPGDSLYIYTDGVAEATNAQEELYGTDRMIDALNRHGSEPVEELLPSIKREVDTFVGEAPQFDDITMLALRYRGPVSNL